MGGGSSPFHLIDNSRLKNGRFSTSSRGIRIVVSLHPTEQTCHGFRQSDCIALTYPARVVLQIHYCGRALTKKNNHLHRLKTNKIVHK